MAEVGDTELKEVYKTWRNKFRVENSVAGERKGRVERNLPNVKKGESERE